MCTLYFHHRNRKLMCRVRHCDLLLDINAFIVNLMLKLTRWYREACLWNLNLSKTLDERDEQNPNMLAFWTRKNIFNFHFSVHPTFTWIMRDTFIMNINKFYIRISVSSGGGNGKNGKKGGKDVHPQEDKISRRYTRNMVYKIHREIETSHSFTMWTWIVRAPRFHDKMMY